MASPTIWEERGYSTQLFSISMIITAFSMKTNVPNGPF